MSVSCVVLGGDLVLSRTCPLVTQLALLLRMNQLPVQVSGYYGDDYLSYFVIEFDQFLAQRVNVGTSLPPARTKPQMQKAEEQSDELFAL